MINKVDASMPKIKTGDEWHEDLRLHTDFKQLWRHACYSRRGDGEDARKRSRTSLAGGIMNNQGQSLNKLYWAGRRQD